MPLSYQKHLIECRCTLAQYKNREPPVFHSFVVFSIVGEDGMIQPSFELCNNCNVLHKIIETGTSQILKKDELKSALTVEEIKSGFPVNLQKLIKSYDLDLATCKEIKFLLEQEMWGKGVVLSKERMDDTTVGKYLIILGEELFKIDSFEREDMVKL